MTRINTRTGLPTDRAAPPPGGPDADSTQSSGARLKLRNAFLQVWASVPLQEDAAQQDASSSSSEEDPAGGATSGSPPGPTQGAPLSCSSPRSCSTASPTPKTSRHARRRSVAGSKDVHIPCAHSFCSSSTCPSPRTSPSSSSPDTGGSFRRRSVAVSGREESGTPPGGGVSTKSRESLRTGDAPRGRAGSLPLPSLVGLVLFRKLYLARLKRQSATSNHPPGVSEEGQVGAVEQVAEANAADQLREELLGCLQDDLPRTPRFCSTLSPAAQLAMLQTYEDKLHDAPSGVDAGRQMALFEETLERLLAQEGGHLQEGGDPREGGGTQIKGGDHHQGGDPHQGHGDPQQGGDRHIQTQLQASRLFEKVMHLVDDARRSADFSRDQFDPHVFRLDRKTRRPRVSFQVD